jgi:hypothetical protein
MPVSRKVILLSAIVFLFSPGSFLTLCAQERALRDTIDIAKPSIHFPYRSEIPRLRMSGGFSMVMPPKDMLETAVQAPLGNFHAIYDLPWNFSIEGDISSIIVSNQLSLGPSLSIYKGNFGIKTGYDIAFVAGILKQFGFNNSTRAWLHYPNVSLGYKKDRMAFTLEAEAVLVSFATTRTGENEITNSSNFFNGFTGAFYIEQRLHKNRIFVIGFKDSYVKYYWPTWLVFSTFNKFYNIPELCFSLIL